MKSKAIKKIALLAAIFAAITSQAQLITYEGFNYTAGTVLAGDSGGTGWGLNWSIDGSSATNAVIGSASLSISNSVWLTTNGLSVAFGNGPIYTRTFSSTLGNSSSTPTTRWVSLLFLGATNTTPNESRIGFYSGMNTSGDGNGNAITSSSGTTQVVDVGRAATGADVFSLYNGTTIHSNNVTGNGVAVSRGSTAAGSTAAFLLLKFDLNGTATADTVSLWVNPDIALGEGGLGAAQATWTTANLDLINGLRFQAGSSGAFSVDEIRLGRTFADVTPVTTYYTLTSSGDPCSGALTIGLSGSDTANAYLLYTNSVYSGQSVAGNGLPISFGVQNIPAKYTILASNTVTANLGLMYGSTTVFSTVINITQQPASAIVITNVPASFSVIAIGNALSYQWYKNGVALTNGGHISGAQTKNLLVSPAQPADEATTLNGYYVVLQDPCGNIATSAPPAALTLAAPRNLIWAGGNPGSDWNFANQEFTLSGNPVAFQQGDNTTFNDSSSFQSVTMSNNLTPTLMTVSGTASYILSGPNKITGISQLVDSSSGTLTIVNANDYTGGTTVGNGSTLSLGNGTGIKGSVTGTVTVAPSGTLNFSSLSASASGVLNIQNALAGSGTVNINDGAGATYATGLNLISSNFNGTINIQGYTALHAVGGNAGYALGNGSTVNVPANTQVWLDNSATAYNNTFNIAGTGWAGATPQTGAMRVYNCSINGPINLLDNARIGGSINGATLQGVISGAYQLEVWGNTNSYVLVMGPTNGSPQSYASTLITAGSISAVNSNAISSGPLTLDVGGDLRVNGNNVTVTSLASINSGQVLQIEGARVRNMHATLPGTLTVGTDGSSSQFDGTFSDGAAAAFGLTKVGAGTLTLTALSTNTGAVTVNGGTIAMSGSGSFNKASAIAIGNGATYDVSAAGGTLTLSANQTLKHSGVATGPITITGSVNIGSGALRLAINHAGLAHDSLAASGSVTYSGTLAVTNIGAALQAGDVFQLFAGPASGFTTFDLQTEDTVNNVKYTWNNTVTSDGKLTVQTVSSLVNPNPPQVQVSVTGSTLHLAWPTNAGWTLLTNSVSLAATSQWFPYPNSANLTNVDITINPAKTNVFFKMAYPYP